MKALLLKAAPWVLIAGAALAWFKTEQARAREAGRVEVLVEQRDSVLAVHDSAQQSLQDKVDSLQARRDTVVLQGDAMLDTLLVSVQDTVLRERIRTVVDTVKVACMICQEQLYTLQIAFDSEKREHINTRGLLDAARKQRRGGRLSFGVSINVVSYGLTSQEFHVEPQIAAGFNIRIF